MRTNRSSGRGAMISHRSHLSITEMIRENLGKENMSKLLASQFSPLFDIQSIKFQGQLFNLLLRSLDKSSRSRNCLSFSICGRHLEFSRTDFALITGLKFNDWYDPPAESEIHRVVFRGKQTVTLGDVIPAFKKECRDSDGKSLLSLRLAFLLVLFGVVLVVGGKNNNIDIRYLHLIDDIDKFTTFPWGCVAYHCLVTRTHRARDVLENLIKNDKKLAFDANGFVIALQVWAYEVLPVLARNCATHIEGYEVIYPRIRRWSATSPFKFDLLNKLILKSSPETYMPIKADVVEQDIIKNLGVDEGTDIDMFHENEGNDKSLSKRPRLNLNEKSKLEDVISGEPTCAVKSLAQLSAEVGNLVKVVADLKQSLKIVNRETVLHDEREINQTPIPTLKIGNSGYLFRQAQVGDISTESLLNRAAWLTFTSYCHQSDAVEKTHQKTHSNATNVEVPFLCKKYDPNEPSFSGILMKSFENWITESKSNFGPRRLSLPFVRGLIVGVDWFSPLCNRGGWLKTEHIDALLNMIIINSKTLEVKFNADWTIMEMLCWNALTSENDDTLRDRVGPYVSGLRPGTGQLHWARAKHVYGVGNINDNHWVAYEVSLEHRRITVFDSNSRNTSLEALEEKFKLVGRNISKLLQALHTWEFRGSSDSGNDFDVVIYRHPPQQVNCSDCGVLAIKFIECLVTGSSVDLVDSSRCGAFRLSYCRQIFDLAVFENYQVEEVD